MAQYVVVYYPHGGSRLSEANGPFRSEQAAQAEVERIQAVETATDPYYGWTPHVVELDNPVRFELEPEFMPGGKGLR